MRMYACACLSLRNRFHLSRLVFHDLLCLCLCSLFWRKHVKSMTIDNIIGLFVARQKTNKQDDATVLWTLEAHTTKVTKTEHKCLRSDDKKEERTSSIPLFLVMKGRDLAAWRVNPSVVGPFAFPCHVSDVINFSKWNQVPVTRKREKEPPTFCNACQYVRAAIGSSGCYLARSHSRCLGGRHLLLLFDSFDVLMICICIFSSLYEYRIFFGSVLSTHRHTHANAVGTLKRGNKQAIWFC